MNGLPAFRMLARVRRAPGNDWLDHVTMTFDPHDPAQTTVLPIVTRRLCEFVWHDDSNTIAPHELGFLGTHFPKAIFCDEPATGIVMHRSHLTGRVASHDYCAEHGRLIADKVAAIEVRSPWQDDAWNYALTLRFQHGDFSRWVIPDVGIYDQPHAAWYLRAWRALRRLLAPNP